MFKINDMATALNQSPTDDAKLIDKALRNLSQRVYLPAESREGRADIYAAHTACALRLIVAASDFGLHRSLLDGFARWMQHRPNQPLSFDPIPPIQEALRRTKDGEDFNFEIHAHGADGNSYCTTWKVDLPDAAERALHTNEKFDPTPNNLSSFMIVPASAIIRDFLPRLNRA